MKLVETSGGDKWWPDLDFPPINLWNLPRPDRYQDEEDQIEVSEEATSKFKEKCNESDL